LTQTASFIPLVDLKAAHTEVADAVATGWQDVLDNTAFVLGSHVARFEQAYADFVGCRHCIGVSSGTDALELALRALGIGPGDEVIVPVNTFIATALSVVRSGATPVFVDCDSQYLLIDVDRIGEKINDHTKAIVPVHLYGQMAPMDRLTQLATDAGLVLIEDAAQTQGAKQNGESAGAIGKAAATSFYPGKNLGAYGDGGAVTTDDEQLAHQIKALRNYGSTVKYQHPQIGFNCRLDALQAVVLSAKLPLLDDWNAKRRTAAAGYDRLLAADERIAPVPAMPGNEHIYHLYVIRVAQRDRVLKYLNENGVGAGIHYPQPLHLTGAFAHLGHAPDEFPEARQACDHILSLPMYPHITSQQQQQVTDTLFEALDSIG